MLLVAAAFAFSYGSVSGPLLARAAASPEEGDPFSLVDDDGFAKIESRSVDGLKVKETRITATLKWPAKRLIALVGDVLHYPQFMPPTETAQVLSQSGNSGHFYIVIDPPVVHRRDYCVAIDIVKLHDGQLQSRFRGARDACPDEKPGLVRMSRVEGSWTLTPLPDGSTRVVYDAVTDPAGSVPTWMVNRAAGGSVRDMFHALDKAAADSRIAACPASGSIGCF